jgi:hypothetical protein
MNYLISTPMDSPAVARKLTKQAVEFHAGFVQALTTARERAFECGLALLNAQGSLPAEESFEDILGEVKGQLPRRTAYHYMAFTRTILQWAQMESPKAKEAKLIAKAREIVLRNGASFLELMRDAKLLVENTGGGHRSPAYQGGEQTYFNFDIFEQFTSTLRTLDFKPLRQVPAERLVEMRKDLADTVREIDSLLAAKEGEAAESTNDQAPSTREVPSANHQKNFGQNGHGVNAPANGHAVVNGNGRGH